MKKIILLLLIPLNYFSQEKRKCELGINLSVNYINFNNLNFNWTNFTKDIPNPDVNDSSYKLQSNHGKYPFFNENNNYLNFGLELVLYPKKINSKKFISSLKIGFNNSTGLNYSNNWSKSETIRYDTLVSTQNGKNYFLDSFNEYYANKSFQSKLITLNISSIFEQKNTKNSKLYIGFSTSLGIGYHSKSSYFETKYSYSNLSYSNDLYQDSQSESTQLNFKNKNYLNFRISIPFGLKQEYHFEKRPQNSIIIRYEINFGKSWFYLTEIKDFNRFISNLALNLYYKF